MPDVAIPYGYAKWKTIETARKIHGIATPVCALARNDVDIFGVCG